MTNNTITAFTIVLLALTSFSCFAKKHEANPLILISIDGFRYDYIEKYKPKNLLALIQNGVRAERMYPSYPSKTFPNHITLVTGMYPSNHGLVHNSFYDRQLNDVYKMGKAKNEPKWLQATPLWIHAEKNNMRTASYFWPESDAKLEGFTASYYYAYNKQTPYQVRIDQIVNWLKLPKNKRPTFITSYFSLVDTQGHEYGPDSLPLQKAVYEVDGYIGQLKKRIDQELGFKVNLVIVSDHGMVNIDPKKSISWQKLDRFSDYKVINGTTQLMLYANKGLGEQAMQQQVLSLNKDSKDRFHATMKTNIAKKLHYTDNDRIADIIVEAHPPATFTNKNDGEAGYLGMHGYDPYAVADMAAIFIGNGPDFKEGLLIPAFENIHVFPALVDILGLPMPDNIDGRLTVLAPYIK